MLERMISQEASKTSFIESQARTLMACCTRRVMLIPDYLRDDDFHACNWRDEPFDCEAEHAQ